MTKPSLRNAKTDDEMLDDSDAAIERALSSSNSDTVKELRSIVERLERLEEEKKGLSDDQKDIKAEAKGRGFDTKAITRILAIRKMKKEDFQQQEGVLETYMEALGML